MMQLSGIRTFVFAAVIIAAGSAIYLTTNYIATVRPHLPEEYHDTDLSLQGSRLRGRSLGMEGLIADVYWMTSLQYLGNKIVNSQTQVNIDDLTDLRPRLLYPYLNAATDLDPQFMAAYSYGATVLPAVDPQQAVALAEKGIANNPEDWHLYHQLGYIHWRMGNYDEAAAAYQAGSELPGAPQWIRIMAANMQTKGGSRELARQMYLQMLDGAADEQTKAVARVRLLGLKAADQIDAANKILTDRRERSGRCAVSTREITAELAAAAVPAGSEFQVTASGELADPSGVPYLINGQTCTLSVDAQRSAVRTEN